MSPELTAVVEPFVRRGLFPSVEMAISELARDYTGIVRAGSLLDGYNPFTATTLRAGGGQESGGSWIKYTGYDFDDLLREEGMLEEGHPARTTNCCWYNSPRQ